MRKSKHIQDSLLRWVASASLVMSGGALTIVSCGPIKSQDDKVVVVESQPAPETMSSNAKEEEAIKQFLELYRAFADTDGQMSRQGFSNLLNRFQNEIGSFLRGSGLTPEQLIGFMFNLDGNKDDRLSPKEIISGLENRIPFLQWYKDKPALSHDELSKKFSETYPEASEKSRERLLSTLMRFDESWADGDADGLLSRSEAVVPGVAMSLISSADLSEGLKPEHLEAIIPGSSEDGLVKTKRSFVSTIIEEKFCQLQFKKYSNGWTDFKKIPADDKKLEWMRFTILSIQADVALRPFSKYDPKTGSGVEPSQVVTALRPFGFEATVENVKFLMSFYDNPAALGNANGKLDSLEAFNLLADYAWSQELVRGGDLQFESLLPVLPSAGQSLLSKSKDIFSRFDSRERGGDENGTLSAAELTMALAYMRSTDWMYRIYDINLDGEMSQKEMGIMLGDLVPKESPEMQMDGNGKLKAYAVRLFFADLTKDLSFVEIDDKGNIKVATIDKAGRGLNFLLRGAGVFSSDLSPYDFFTRYDKLAPGLTEKLVLIHQRKGD